MTGHACLALFEPTSNSFPASAAFAEYVASPSPLWQAYLQKACIDLGYQYWPQ